MALAPVSAKKTNPIPTSFDINDYRNRLNNIISPDGKALVPQVSPYSSISSNLYPKTPAPATPFYPTPDGKAPAPTPTPTPAPTPTPKAPAVPAPAAPAAGGSYVVKAGDSLSKIAAANGMTLANLLALNPTYKANPSLVRIGAAINVKGAAPVNIPSPAGAPAAGAPVDPAQQKADELAAAAGKAGLSVQEYQALVDRGSVVSKEESDNIKKELGIPELETEVFKKPSKSSEKIFKQAYASAGLADVKVKIANLDKEITKARSDLTEATGAIDENPFLTETSRVGRGKRVLDQAEQKISNLLSQKQQYNDLYTEGIKEINDSILRQQNDFQINNEISTAQLNYLIAKSDKEIEQLENTKKSKANDSVGSYLKGISDNKAPTTIGNSESGFYKYDDVTKKFVQVIAPSALTVAQTKKALADAENGGDGDTFKPTADQKALVGRFANSSAGVALGITAEDKKKMYTDSNFFYWLLQKASEEGFY